MPHIMHLTCYFAHTGDDTIHAMMPPTIRMKMPLVISFRLLAGDVDTDAVGLVAIVWPMAIFSTFEGAFLRESRRILAPE